MKPLSNYAFLLDAVTFMQKNKIRKQGLYKVLNEISMVKQQLP
jgi:hypothetical protein